MAKILIVDDEDSFRRVLCLQTRRLKYDVVEAEDGKAAWEYLQKDTFQAVVTDLKMPEVDGLELLQRIRRDFPQIPVIMITAHGTIDTAVEAMKRGAFDYITKPFDPADFAKILERAISASEASSKEFHRSRSFLRQEEKIIGTTEEMEKIYSIIERVAQSNSNIMITGEVGTGKDIVARLLHDKSDRRQFPLVMAHISATPAHQQHDSIFGNQQKAGWLELADQGTVYFDEIGALTLENQAELYSALTVGSFERNGIRLRLACRIIAASDFNLLEKIENGSFRKDLFYFLNVVPIYLPPLRDRTQDIEPLCDHFTKVFSKKFQKQIERIDDEAVFQLVQYPWPGNIRELENCMEYSVNLCDGNVIQKKHLPAHLFGTPFSARKSWGPSAKDLLMDRVENLERSLVEEALRSSKGDILRASQKLGVPPSLLEQKITNLKLPSS